jgi:hypothetical protein
MKKIIFGSMLLGGAFMASCSDNVYEAPVNEEYSKSFVERFGPISPEQDWNLAERKSVTVNPGSATNVKIYAATVDAYRLVGDFSNLSGKTTLQFDAAQNVNDFIVYAGNKALNVKNGETADFSVLSRNYKTEVANVWKKLTEEKVFQLNDVAPFLQKLREDIDNRNNETVHTDFLALTTAARSIKVYPVYWNAGYHHTLGIYTYDEDDNKTYHPIYDSKTGNDVTVKFSNKNNYVTPMSVPCWNGGDNSNYAINNANTWVQSIKSKGFEITLPEGIVFGFYIEAWNSSNQYIGKWHSEKALNTGDQGGRPNGHAAFTTVTTEVDGVRRSRTFLGFEDTQMPAGTYCDNDLNDLVIIFDPAPVIIDNTTDEWILAAEDLGQIDDYDFNDMVVSVKHVAGQETAEITPRAAGGVYELYLTRNGQTVGDEFHKLISPSVTKDENGQYPMLNTSAAGAAGQTFTIDVPKTFSMATYGDRDQMGSFGLTVKRKNQTPSEVVVTPPGLGDTPQMICVPANFKWPKERVGMEVAYPSFGNFGLNYTNVDWMKSQVADKVLFNK